MPYEEIDRYNQEKILAIREKQHFVGADLGLAV